MKRTKPASPRFRAPSTTKELRRLQAIRLIQLAPGGRPVIGLFSKIPAEVNARLQKLGLLPLFGSPPKWAL